MRTRCFGGVVRNERLHARSDLLSGMSLRGDINSLSSSLIRVVFSDATLDFGALWDSESLFSANAGAGFSKSFNAKVRKVYELQEIMNKNSISEAQIVVEQQIKKWSDMHRAGTLGEGYGTDSAEVVAYEQREKERKRALLLSLKASAETAAEEKKRARAEAVQTDRERMEKFGSYFVPEIPSELREKAERWLYEKYGKEVGSPAQKRLFRGKPCTSNRCESANF